MWLLPGFLFLFFIRFTASQYEPLISSSWSMWSPWSFCSNNVMIRVRACSTVRGYKCVGHNKEFQTCNSPPARRNNFDYEDPEVSDRELAMKQLYQDYEPEIPDEAKFTPPANKNFHFIGTTTLASTVTTNDPTISILENRQTGLDLSDDMDETMSMVKPTSSANLPQFSHELPSFNFEKFPSSPRSGKALATTTTTEATTTTTEATTTTTTTTTEAPTTTNPEPESELEPEPQTVTPAFPTTQEVAVERDFTAFVEDGIKNVEFKGKYTLEEPLPGISLPTTQNFESSPPGTSNPTPTSYPIRSELEVEPEGIDGSTHSVGSYSIGKVPSENLEPLVETGPMEVEPTPKMPTFSINPSTRKIGDVRRAPPTTANTHIELPSSMFVFDQREEQQEDETRITTTEKPNETHPHIALVTSQQNFQTFPTLMNEQRPYHRHIQKVAPTTEPQQLTVEITKKPLKKKKKVRRLKKLNRLAKSRVLTILPTENTIQVAETVKNTPATATVQTRIEDLFLKTEKPEPSSNLQRDRQVYEETKELEARLLALKHRVDMNKKILASRKSADVLSTTTVATTKAADDKVQEVMVEGDTARALSWMINDMERMVADDTKTEVVDRLPVEKFDRSSEGFIIGEPVTDETPTTTVNPFPFPVGEGFSLIRTKRSVQKMKSLYSEWTEWTNCNCGKQSRERECLKPIGRHYTQTIENAFIPIEIGNDIIDMNQKPAQYPEGILEPEPVVENRMKRSFKCSEPQTQFRYCFSTYCEN